MQVSKPHIIFVFVFHCNYSCRHMNNPGVDRWPITLMSIAVRSQSFATVTSLIGHEWILDMPSHHAYAKTSSGSTIIQYQRLDRRSRSDDLPCLARKFSRSHYPAIISWDLDQNLSFILKGIFAPNTATSCRLWPAEHYWIPVPIKPRIPFTSLVNVSIISCLDFIKVLWDIMICITIYLDDPSVPMFFAVATPSSWKMQSSYTMYVTEILPYPFPQKRRTHIIRTMKTLGYYLLIIKLQDLPSFWVAIQKSYI